MARPSLIFGQIRVTAHFGTTRLGLYIPRDEHIGGLLAKWLYPAHEGVHIRDTRLFEVGCNQIENPVLQSRVVLIVHILIIGVATVSA